MNPQPEEYVGKLLALMAIVVFLSYAYKTFIYGPHMKFENDLFTLGYVEPNDLNVVVNQSSPAKMSIEKTQLYLDCVDALHAIGMKKSQAKTRAKEIFEEHNPTSIQEFLMIALKK
jgi:flagellar biogenesis protein FliO